MSTKFAGLVTVKSNGTITIQPRDGGNVPGKIGPGDEVDVTIEVTKTAQEIEDALAAKKRSLAAGEEPPRAVTKRVPARDRA